MSAGGSTKRTAASPVDTPAGSSAKPDRAGLIFRQLTVLPTLLVTAWLLAGLPLLLAGKFTALLMLVVSLPLAAIIVTFGMRWIPARSQGLLAASGAEPARVPWWALVSLVVVSAAFGIDQFRYHSQQIIVQRDAASYYQFGTWIAHHGSLPIRVDAAAFGGNSHHLLTFASAAFYQVGHSVVPQFMAGEPMALAGAIWAGGASVATATNVLIGACGILAFGGLVGRLVGARWAPLGALVLALSLPEQYTSRNTFSEPLAQVLFLGGLCLVIDSFSAEGATRRKLAALAGIAMGLTLLVRIDGLSDLLPLIPYCGLLLLTRRPQAWPLIGGAAFGALYGAIDGYFLSRPYLHGIKSSLLPLLAIGALVLAGTIAAVLILWHRGLPTLRSDWLPNVAAALCFVVLIGLALRPYVQTVKGKQTPSGARAMTAFERADHLAIQPNRLFYEISLHWIYWYLGVPIVILATIGAAILARRCLRGGAEAWTLPLMAFAWIIVTVLVRPGITPDQPWASRRLVPGVLPGFIVLALWASSWLLAWLRRRGTGQALRVLATIVLAAAMILPAIKTTFGIAHRSGGPLGVRIVAVGLADKVAFNGEVEAVQRMCAAIPAHSSVLFVGGKAGGEMTEVIRGMCGEPAAKVRGPSPSRVAELVAAIQRSGRTPVLLASDPQELAPYGGTPRQIVALHSRGDTHTLVTPPLGTIRLTINIWMSEFPQ